MAHWVVYGTVGIIGGSMGGIWHSENNWWLTGLYMALKAKQIIIFGGTILYSVHLVYK